LKQSADDKAFCSMDGIETNRLKENDPNYSLVFLSIGVEIVSADGYSGCSRRNRERKLERADWRARPRASDWSLPSSTSFWKMLCITATCRGLRFPNTDRAPRRNCRACGGGDVRLPDVAARATNQEEHDPTVGGVRQGLLKREKRHAIHASRNDQFRCAGRGGTACSDIQ